jgi:hypothetical protein
VAARNILARRNRGVLLDVLVFVVNLVLMRLLTDYFIQIVRLAGAGDPLAEFELGLFFLGALVLPAAAAVFKRWHFHQEGGPRPDRSAGGRGKSAARETDAALGCLLHPAFYFSVSVCLAVSAAVILGGKVFGESFQKDGAIFLPVVFGAFALCLVQTWLVYRYFSPPKKPPRFAFLLDPRSALLGDACVYVNMILFQVMWNVLLSGRAARVGGFEDFAGRLFLLLFVSLLVYFPPRIFYLAGDVKRPAAWLTMLLANSPVILRVLFGIHLNVFD